MNFASLMKKKIIVLHRKGLCDDNLDLITNVLHKSEVLEVLHLSHNQITLADGKFSYALARNRSLRILNLGFNSIAAEGARWLAAAFKANDTLQKIQLDGNQIGIEGAKSLADALVTNQSLAHISLNANNIGDGGAHNLAASFEENQSIRVIGLRANKISGKGAQILANALECNHTIEKIDTGFDASDDAHIEIQRALDNPQRKVNQLEMIISKYEKTIAVKDKVKDEEITIKNEMLERIDKSIASPEPQAERKYSKQLLVSKSKINTHSIMASRDEHRHRKPTVDANSPRYESNLATDKRAYAADNTPNSKSPVQQEQIQTKVEKNKLRKVNNMRKHLRKKVLK